MTAEEQIAQPGSLPFCVNGEAPGNNEPVMTIDGLSLRYRTRTGFFGRTDHTVLDNISFQVYPGETLGVIGRNGCGKSSLLRLLSGVINPTGGRVNVAPGVRRALLSLGLGFKPDLSGRDNALLSMMLQGISKSSALTFLDDIAEFSELGDFFCQPVKTYSAGMRARLGFATAFKSEVDVMLIDETLSVGDLHFRHKAEAALEQKILGKQTAVLVSHNLDQMKKLCTRAVWLEDSSIVFGGGVIEVIEKYRTAMEG